MELDGLRIHDRQTGPQNHRQPVACVVTAVCRNPKHLPGAAGGQDGCLGQDGDELPFFDFEQDGSHATALVEKEFRNDG
jgi:hypothetical protein